MRMLNRAQEHYWQIVVESYQSYFMTTGTISYLEDQELYTLPAGCERIILAARTDYDPPRNVDETSLNYRFKYINLNDGYNRYYFQGNQIGILPVPSADNSECLTLWYVYRPIDIHFGTAAAGSTSSITLATTPSVGELRLDNDYYNNATVRIISGTGAGQDAKITDYVGSTKVASATFTTAPDNTSVYSIQSIIPEPFHQLLTLKAAIIAKHADEKTTSGWQNDEAELQGRMMQFIDQRGGKQPFIVERPIGWQW